MPVPLLFVVALLVGYFRPVLILVMFPFLLLYGGMWALLLGIGLPVGSTVPARPW